MNTGLKDGKAGWDRPKKEIIVIFIEFAAR